MQCSKMTLKAILEDRVVPTEALRTAPVEGEGKQRNTFHLTAAYLHSNIRWITFMQNVEGNVFFLLFLQEQNKCDNILKHKAILDQLQSGFSILGFNKELEKAPSKFEHFFVQSSDEVSPAFVVSLLKPPVTHDSQGYVLTYFKMISTPSCWKTKATWLFHSVEGICF